MTQVKGAALTAAVLVAIAAGSAWRPAAAQATAAAAAKAERRSGGPSVTEDVLPALLIEVKGLRAAMEQMASSNAQAQLLVGRLQLQEGRINGMIRRLDTIRDTLVSAKRDFERMKGVQKMMEGGEHEPGQPKEDLGPMIEGVKKEAAAAQANVDRLTAEEAQLTSDLSVEQSRWVDINRRLDELERTLAKR